MRFIALSKSLLCRTAMSTFVTQLSYAVATCRDVIHATAFRNFRPVLADSLALTIHARSAIASVRSNIT